MTRRVPKVFYERLADGLDLFVGALGFAVLDKTDACVVFSPP